MPPVIGLDFGTTNSAIAVADAGKDATLASFRDGSATTTSFRSILYFPPNQASEPDKVAALIQIISENLGYALYRAVENTKVALTENEVADFVFAHFAVNIKDTLERWRFESWIQEDMQSIATCVKTLFRQHNINYGDIGSVFLTGGSSFVPYVRRFFAKTFGSHKLKGGEELTTVAKGLALRALENG